MKDSNSIQQIVDLARQALLENNTDMARKAIEAADALAGTQSADAALKTLLYSLDLRALWGIGFLDAIRDLIQVVDHSPAGDLEKNGHHRAIQAVAQRQMRNYPDLQDWIAAARQPVAVAAEGSGSMNTATEDEHG